jgi:hypothetical protein
MFPCHNEPKETEYERTLEVNGGSRQSVPQLPPPVCGHPARAQDRRLGCGDQQPTGDVPSQFPLPTDRIDAAMLEENMWCNLVHQGVLERKREFRGLSKAISDWFGIKVNGGIYFSYDHGFYCCQAVGGRYTCFQGIWTLLN